jgi:ABC-type transport system involved in multi-copper enzyme maturation permease subunit
MDKILLVAQYTFKEILKSKVLLNIFFIGLALILVTYVATEFTFGVPERIALDFGLGMLSLSTLGISLFLGVNLLSSEIESRTVYMIISRPVPRSNFILGKLLGLMGIQAINVALLSLMTLSATVLLGGNLDSLIFWTVGFIFLESLLLLLVVVFISLFANNILAVLFSVVVLLLGHAIKDTQQTSLVERSDFLKVLLDVYHFILPGFYKLNLKDYILYESELPLSYLFSAASYGIFYSGFLLVMIILIFNKKNLD